MANSNPQPGFVLPPQHQMQGHHDQYSAYPQQQAQYPGYPPQQAPYPGQPYPPPAYQHQPFPGPIQQQPGFGNQSNQMVYASWINNPNFQDYLRNATSFHVKQKVELLETIAGWETPNKYTVKDQGGHKVFLVGEESGCLTRQICGASRPFSLTVKDTRGLDVLFIDRPLDCSCCFACCCPDKMTVSTAGGQKLGSISESCSLIFPKFDLKDAAGNVVLKIEGPFCPMAFGRCQPAIFRVQTPDGVSVGTISKEWSGLVRELFTDADYFSMSFPPNLDPSMKAVCLGALFLIDYEYFEAGHSGRQGGRRLFG